MFEGCLEDVWRMFEGRLKETARKSNLHAFRFIKPLPNICHFGGPFFKVFLGRGRGCFGPRVTASLQAIFSTLPENVRDPKLAPAHEKTEVTGVTAVTAVTAVTEVIAVTELTALRATARRQLFLQW